MENNLSKNYSFSANIFNLMIVDSKIKKYQCSKQKVDKKYFDTFDKTLNAFDKITCATLEDVFRCGMINKISSELKTPVALEQSGFVFKKLLCQ
jgi:hypothetical protein